MSVFKRYKGQRITSKHPAYANARWWVYKRIKGHKTLHQSIPEARTREQAEHAERKLVDAIFNQKYGIADTVTTFKDFAEGPYKRYCEQNNVNIVAKNIYIAQLVRVFKHRPLSDITPQDCRDCQWTIKQKATSAASVNRAMSTLSKLFSIACEEGILDRNPMQYVKMLQEPKGRTRLLSAEEKESLWKELEKDTLLLQIVTLAINLPLRRGQLLALTPDAVDWQNGQIYTIGSKGRGARFVPLNSTALTTLKLMNENGHLPFPLKDFRKRWHRALREAKIEDYRFHDLRREFASELIRKNVNPNIVQKLFAHSDMRITNVYMHSDIEELKAAVNSLDESILQPSQELDGPPN